MLLSLLHILVLLVIVMFHNEIGFYCLVYSCKDTALFIMQQEI